VVEAEDVVIYNTLHELEGAPADGHATDETVPRPGVALPDPAVKNDEADGDRDPRRRLEDAVKERVQPEVRHVVGR
jgi:hypothetical protein